MEKHVMGSKLGETEQGLSVWIPPGVLSHELGMLLCSV